MSSVDQNHLKKTQSNENGDTQGLNSHEIETPTERWFVHYQNKVQGPFSSDELQNNLNQSTSEQIDKTLLWKRGLADWMKASIWRPDVDYTPRASSKISTEQTSRSTAKESTLKPNTPPQSKSTTPSPIKTHPPAPPSLSKSTVPSETVTRAFTDFDKTVTRVANEPSHYQVQLNFVDQPPMTHNDLLSFIAKLDDVSGVSIKDPKTQEWKEVYAFTDIIEKLGLSRRKHPRVPILAQFSGKSNKNPQFTARIITISEGGMGFTDLYELKIGDHIEGQITSPHFFQPINIKADVVFAGLDGYIGLNFTQINEESRSTIIEYVKKFGRG